MHAPALAEGEGGGGAAAAAAAAAAPSSARSVEEGVVSEEAAGGRGAAGSREHGAEGILAESVTERVSAAEKRSEEVERIRVVMCEGEASRGTAYAASAPATGTSSDTLGPESVKSCTFVFITQNLVSFTNFLEHVFRTGIFILVWVIFQGHFSVCLFNLILACIFLDSKNIVIVFTHVRHLNQEKDNRLWPSLLLFMKIQGCYRSQLLIPTTSDQVEVGEDDVESVMSSFHSSLLGPRSLDI